MNSSPSQPEAGIAGGPAQDSLGPIPEATGSDVVNIAGRQRMLGQRLVKEVLARELGMQSNPEGTFALLVESAQTMLHGGVLSSGKRVGDKPLKLARPSVEIDRSVLNEQVRTLEQIRELLQRVSAQSDGQREETLQALVTAGGAFHTAADQTTANFAKYYSERNKQGRQQSLELAGMLQQAASANASRITKIKASADSTQDSIKGVAASTGEMATSINSIGENTQSAADAAKTAAGDSSSASLALTELLDKVSTITQVADLIRSVSNQTRLLAINASIEAARAGEAGRGFAVVASEVKHLAGETDSATRQIDEQVAEVSASAQVVESALERMVKVVEQINGLTDVVAQELKDQGTASSEIATNLQRAVSSTQQITTGIEEILGTSEEMAQMSDRHFQAVTKGE
ncbi:MAG: methyl-accepting chemotaxis protein [Pseudomonadota bacterium]